VQERTVSRRERVRESHARGGKSLPIGGMDMQKTVHQGIRRDPSRKLSKGTVFGGSCLTNNGPLEAISYKHLKKFRNVEKNVWSQNFRPTGERGITERRVACLVKRKRPDQKGAGLPVFQGTSFGGPIYFGEKVSKGSG